METAQSGWTATRSAESYAIIRPLMDIIDLLQTIRRRSGQARTVGLPDVTLREFAGRDPMLVQAVSEAVQAHANILDEFPDLAVLPESEQVEALQSDLVNFYADDAVNPYVALAARGPWIVTSCGAVLHDSGGYGMLGLGHGPQGVLEAMGRSHVMANVMTASYSQKRLTQALKREIGHQRGHCPFRHFLFVNSGSESVSVAARLADVNARIMTDAGGRHAGKSIRLLSLKGGFHGRTERPAQFSDSSRKSYVQHLASFRDWDLLWTVVPNDRDSLEAAFTRAEKDNVFIEAMFMEPVMGEGNPGMAITREFYDTARRLTLEHGTLLLVDSIQAGLRTTGSLSICDYPGFETCQAPDMETYSKALNAGQYPLSVLAMTERASALYRKGIYGNTMTGNPRAMDVGVAVLEELTPELRHNIRERGTEFLERFTRLAAKLDGMITKVQGSGLLLSVELSDAFKCFGEGSTEEWLRLHGIGVIHGGQNSLRFTPHFAITSAEVAMVVDTVGEALVKGPRQNQPARAVAASR